MDAFMVLVLDALREHGSRAVRVFPPAAGVLLSFADRIATEVVRCQTSCIIHVLAQPRVLLGFRIHRTTSHPRTLLSKRRFVLESNSSVF